MRRGRSEHEPHETTQTPEPGDEALWLEYLTSCGLTLALVRTSDGQPCPCYACNANRRFFWQWMENR